MDTKKEIDSLKRLNTFLFGAVLILIGGVGNLAVMLRNGGLMPVYQCENLNSEFHYCFQDKAEVNNFLLTDWIHIKDFAWISIGDIVIFLGSISILIFLINSLPLITKSGVQRWKKRNKNQIDGKQQH